MSERSSLAAVVLAGGFGTRLRSVVSDVPKPMAPVAGRPFLEWVLRFLAGQGIADVAISTGYMAETVEAHFAATVIPGIRRIRCVHEPEPLGTAGGFLHTVRGAGWESEAWLCLNGDSLALTPLAGLTRTLLDGRPGLLALHMEEAARYGSLEVGDDGNLLAFREKRPGSAWINAGVYGVPAGRLDGFAARRPLSWETDVFPAWIADGTRVEALRVEGPFLDIGLPESYAEAERFIRDHPPWFGLRHPTPGR